MSAAPELPEEAKEFLAEVEKLQQDMIKKHDGIIGLAIVVNWDKEHQEYPKCILETNMNKVVNMEMQTPALAMHDLLVNSGGVLIKQLLIHAAQQLKGTEAPVPPPT